MTNRPKPGTREASPRPDIGRAMGLLSLRTVSCAVLVVLGSFSFRITRAQRDSISGTGAGMGDGSLRWAVRSCLRGLAAPPFALAALLAGYRRLPLLRAPIKTVTGGSSSR